MNEPRWTDDQERAIGRFEDFLVSTEVSIFILRGAAGTGKSELISEFCRRAQEHKADVLCLAPTGQAARRLSQRIRREVSTVHSAIYEGSGSEDNGEDAPPTAVFSLKTERPSQALTIVDEASLVGDTCMTSVDQKPILRFGSGRLLSDLLEYCLAGSGKLVFVGDDYQVAAVGEEFAVALERSTYDSRGLGVSECELVEVVRQAKGSDIAALGGEIRAAKDAAESSLPRLKLDGDEIHEVGYPVDDFVLSTILRGDGVVLAWRNADVANWNRRVRGHRGAKDETPEIGDHLILVQSAPNLHLMNGDEVRVGAVGEKISIRLGDSEVTLIECEVEIPSDGEIEGKTLLLATDLLEAPSQERIRKVTQVLWVDFVRRMKSVGIDRKNQPGEFWECASEDRRWNALRATYGYARTIYRAQGGEWDLVVFDGSGMNGKIRDRDHSIAYTAVTRARSELHVRRWPARRGSKQIDLDAMCADLQQICDGHAAIKLEVSRLPNAPAPVIEVRSEKDSSLLINVYFKKGILSSIDLRKGGKYAWADELLAEIRAWAFEQLVTDSPPPDEVADKVQSMSDLLSSEYGIDLRVWTHSQYVVGVELLRGAQRHVGHYHHDATGRLTKAYETSMLGGGDRDQSLQAVFENAAQFAEESTRSRKGSKGV
jgi:exodeoxyribonuclease-5